MALRKGVLSWIWRSAQNSIAELLKKCPRVSMCGNASDRMSGGAQPAVTLPPVTSSRCDRGNKKWEEPKLPGLLEVPCDLLSMQTFQAQRCSRSRLEVQVSHSNAKPAPPNAVAFIQMSSTDFPRPESHIWTKTGRQRAQEKNKKTAWEWQASAQLCTGGTGQ